ncbi:hypothetical protein H072_4229 [Dactylellina haptotyla CBS 200.50]|uniref:WSC domain-containing protein n=1 Tax=Dactylellina haptotyla (strain CBS 200.50) TaxID=1284197 RepID=S8AG87_DACHA|nr:hypothetical protein H072_4229 [Dactylellina haptotyla CBS 200.50]
MRVTALIASVAIGFAATAFAAPATSELIPRDGTLEKRGWTYQSLWPAYPGNFTAWKPIGCYSGEVSLTYNTAMCSCQNPGWNKHGEMPFTMQKCFAWCKGAGFRYAGIKGDSQMKSCWCGNGISDDEKLSNAAKCNVPCGEGEGGGIYDENQCGGKTTYTVYKDPCYKDFDGEAEIANYNYIGCFNYEGGPSMPYWIGQESDNLSVDSCIEHCASKGFAYSAMAASGSNCWLGTQCQCTGKLPKAWIDRHNAYPGDNNGCTALCSATAKVKSSIDKQDYQYCGGCWFFSMYFNGNLAEPEICEADPPKVTTTITTPGPTPGTTTIPGKSTDTVIITTPVEKTTVTTTVTGSKPGTTTKTGPTTDSVRITVTPATQVTVTTTVPGQKAGTTTKFVTNEDGDTVTDSGTVSVRITTPTVKPTQVTVTTTVPGKNAGTTTKFVTNGDGDTVTDSGTVSVRITTPTAKPTQATVTRTTPGPSPGTETLYVTDDNGDTVTDSGTVSVIITTTTKPAAYSNHATVTTTVTGDEPGTTTKTGSKTDTVVVTITPDGPTDEPDGPTPMSDHPTTTVTTSGDTPGTTTIPGDNTDTVIITTPSVPTGKVTITTTVSGSKPGTTLIPGSKTDTVRITTKPGAPPATSKTTVTVTTGGPAPGTTTIPGDKTVSVIITTKTGGDAPPTGTPPNDSCCIMPKPSNSDTKMGITYPLGDVNPSLVWTPNKASFVLIKLQGITTNCKTSYKYTIAEFQTACWNGCMEQQKKCYIVYGVKTDVCTGVGKKKKCFSKQELRSQCDTQYGACKLANTNTNKKNNPLKTAMDQCGAAPPEDEEYIDD